MHPATAKDIPEPEQAVSEDVFQLNLSYLLTVRQLVAAGKEAQAEILFGLKEPLLSWLCTASAEAVTALAGSPTLVSMGLACPSRRWTGYWTRTSCPICALYARKESGASSPTSRNGPAKLLRADLPGSCTRPYNFLLSRTRLLPVGITASSTNAENNGVAIESVASPKFALRPTPASCEKRRAHGTRTARANGLIPPHTMGRALNRRTHGSIRSSDEGR